MNKGAVLFVDDEINILNSLRRGLIDEDYTCLFASSGGEALEIMNKEEISVLVTDMRMPGMDGLMLLKEVKLKYPKTVRIVLSGYTQLQQILTTINQVDIFKFITKPWKLEEEFKVVINQALEYYNLQIEGDELKKALENKNTAYQNILKRVDDVIMAAKKESQDLKDISSYVFNYLENIFTSEIQPEELIERYQFCKSVYLNYFEVSTDFKEITLAEIQNELSTYLKGVKGISKLDWTQSSNVDIKVKFNQKMSIFIISSLISSLISDDEKHYVKFLNEVKNISNESCTYEFSILISGLAENNTAYLKEKIERVTVNTVLNQLFLIALILYYVKSVILKYYQRL